MNLSKFVVTAHNDVNNFMLYWDTGHKEKPKPFPTDMTHDQWLDEFDRWSALVTAETLTTHCEITDKT